MTARLASWLRLWWCERVVAGFFDADASDRLDATLWGLRCAR